MWFQLTWIVVMSYGTARGRCGFSFCRRWWFPFRFRLPTRSTFGLRFCMWRFFRGSLAPWAPRNGNPRGLKIHVLSICQQFWFRSHLGLELPGVRRWGWWGRDGLGLRLTFRRRGFPFWFWLWLRLRLSLTLPMSPFVVLIGWFRGRRRMDRLYLLSDWFSFCRWLGFTFGFWLRLCRYFRYFRYLIPMMSTNSDISLKPK